MWCTAFSSELFGSFQESGGLIWTPDSSLQKGAPIMVVVNSVQHGSQKLFDLCGHVLNCRQLECLIPQACPDGKCSSRGFPAEVSKNQDAMLYEGTLGNLHCLCALLHGLGRLPDRPLEDQTFHAHASSANNQVCWSTWSLATYVELQGVVGPRMLATAASCKLIGDSVISSTMGSLVSAPATGFKTYKFAQNPTDMCEMRQSDTYTAKLSAAPETRRLIQSSATTAEALTFRTKQPLIGNGLYSILGLS